MNSLPLMREDGRRMLRVGATCLEVFLATDSSAGEGRCFTCRRVLPIPFVADEKRCANEEESSKEQSHNQ